MRIAHKPITTLQLLLTNINDKDKPEDRREQSTRSNAATARLLISVKLAETLVFD